MKKSSVLALFDSNLSVSIVQARVPEVGMIVRLETGLDDFVGLEGGDHDVEDPEEDEDSGGDGLDVLGTSQLTTDGGAAAGEEDGDGDQGLNTEDGDGESQAADGDDELLALSGPVDGGQ